MGITGFIIGNICLIGFPFISGFFSKGCIVQNIPFFFFRNFSFLILLRFFPMCFLVISRGFLYIEFIYFDSFFSCIRFFFKSFILLILIFVLIFVPIFLISNLNFLKKMNFLDKGVYDIFLGKMISPFFTTISDRYIYYYNLTLYSVLISFFFLFYYI